MSAIMIKNYTPFNDVNYKTCYFNPLFTMVQSLGGNILPFLANDIFMYDFNTKAECLNLYVKAKNKLSHIDLFKEFGIVYTKSSSNDIIRDVKKAVDSNKMVILFLDNYHYPLTIGTYHVGHSMIAVLVYGYDDDSQQFYVYHMSSPGCKAQVLYTDVVNGYNEILENPIFAGREKYFEIFGIDKSFTSDDICTDKHRNIFIENMQYYREEIYQGLDKLKIGINDYVNCLSCERTMLEAIKKMPDYGHLYLYIKTYKHAENYRNLKLLGYHKELNDRLEHIINDWVLIRGIVTKFIISKKYNSKSMQTVINKLKGIYQLENEYNEKLFNIIDRGSF